MKLMYLKTQIILISIKIKLIDFSLFFINIQD